MHERAAVTRALAELIESADGAIGRVAARIGSGVDVAVVQSTWDQAAAGTRAQSSFLVCEAAADTLRCLDCANTYEGDKLAQCPSCGGNGLVIAAAPEFVIDSWDAA